MDKKIVFDQVIPPGVHEVAVLAQQDLAAKRFVIDSSVAGKLEMLCFTICGVSQFPSMQEGIPCRVFSSSAVPVGTLYDRVLAAQTVRLVLLNESGEAVRFRAELREDDRVYENDPIDTRAAA